MYIEKPVRVQEFMVFKSGGNIIDKCIFYTYNFNRLGLKFRDNFGKIWIRGQVSEFKTILPYIY